MTVPLNAPIIVTAEMGSADQMWADRLRRRFYPVERNLLHAHITLFHHLPPACERELLDMLARAGQGTRPRAELARLLLWGGGVAFHVLSPDVLSIREEIADRFAPLLVPQDKVQPRLHITIQNKVKADVARVTFAELERDFKPRSLAITGLAAWHYAGGPWSLIRRYSFRG